MTEDKHPEINYGKSGVLIVNLGTPDSTSWWDIRKYLNEFLSDWNMSREEFLQIADKFTNKDLFKKDEDGNLIRDNSGNIEKINYDNIN